MAVVLARILDSAISPTLFTARLASCSAKAFLSLAVFSFAARSRSFLSKSSNGKRSSSFNSLNYYIIYLFVFILKLILKIKMK
tara:strand:- start:64 stop:312 length:249 start_codon:yes stop_codon:yes gene_type:complete